MFFCNLATCSVCPATCVNSKTLTLLLNTPSLIAAQWTSLTLSLRPNLHHLHRSKGAINQPELPPLEDLWWHVADGTKPALNTPPVVPAGCLDVASGEGGKRRCCSLLPQQSFAVQHKLRKVLPAWTSTGNQPAFHTDWTYIL